MSEAGAAAASGASAGAQLRAARERQGLHIAALAAAIKMPQRKLEALEADRYDDLPDATFARALALSVCRALKIDAAPVLAQLPRIGDKPLPDVAGGLNTPYRERAGREAHGAASATLRHPLSWAALLLVLAAALVMWLPDGSWRAWREWRASGPASGAASAPLAAPAASATVAAMAAAASAVVEEVVQAASAPASAVVVEVVHATSADPAAASAVAAAPAAGMVVLRSSAPSWVEVLDAGGQVLLQRVLQPGESVGLDGRLPLRLKIGNAAVTSLQFRGREVDLAAVTRDNVARLELK
ncbi:MAG TPA: helix-turn-helix domain-containing protein [Rubrivivax sp.]|nr:helix-turn-helix domain-containing protein [Rubrivivax sp.]